MKAIEVQAVFKEYPKKVLKLLAEVCKHKTRKQNEFIIKKKEPLSSLYLVTEGVCEAFVDVDIEQSHSYPIVRFID